jgi:hypothetical protein
MFRIVEEYSKREVSVDQLCQKYQITRHCFGYWKKKHKRICSEPSKGFIPVTISESPILKQPMVITYPNKVSITINKISDIEIVKSLITLF